METSTVTMIRYCTCNTALFIRVLGQDVHDDDNDDAIAIGYDSMDADVDNQAIVNS